MPEWKNCHVRRGHNGDDPIHWTAHDLCVMLLACMTDHVIQDRRQGVKNVSRAQKNCLVV